MRAEKKSIVSECRQRIDGADFVVFVDCRGLDVAQMSDLRGQLQRVNSRLQVSKNSFVRLAAEGLGWGDISSFLDGPTAVVTGMGDVTAAAKTIRSFDTTKDLPAIKGGKLGEAILSSVDVHELAAIPSREVMLGRVVGTIAAPMTQLVGVMRQKVTSLLYVLSAVAEKKSGGN